MHGCMDVYMHVSACRYAHVYVCRYHVCHSLPMLPNDVYLIQTVVEKCFHPTKLF